MWYAPFSLERDLMKIFTEVHLINIEVIHLLMLRGRGGRGGADVWYAPFSLERDLMKIFT